MIRVLEIRSNECRETGDTWRQDRGQGKTTLRDRLQETRNNLRRQAGDSLARKERTTGQRRHVAKQEATQKDTRHFGREKGITWAGKERR
jgi:hypothetical protein